MAKADADIGSNSITPPVRRPFAQVRPRRLTLGKPAVLQWIALAAQDVPSDAHDRLAMTEKDVLRHIEAALKDQRRFPEKAQEVLEEIVERAGLLLRIDGGVRYRFAHLTLQEYLVATVLAADPQRLLDRYARDPAAWREAVRLWCGVEARDCSDVVREVHERDPVLAFQCLTDAHVIDSGLADRIIGRFRDGLGSQATFVDDAAVITAFGVVAADRRPPGPARLPDAARGRAGRAEPGPC
jgi:hypothetical protein